MNRKIPFIMFILNIVLLNSCVFWWMNCGWSAPILVWVDSNGNGVWDEGEQPVEGVRFQVNDVLNDCENVGKRAISDWEGIAEASVHLPGCPSAKFEVLAFPPEGYFLGSNQVVEIDGSGYGSEDPILFPLNLEPGFPTPTPYAPKLQCQTYPIGAEKLKIAPDGSVWAVTWHSGAFYENKLDKWNTIPFDTDVMSLAENIDIGIDGDVWIRSWNGIGFLQNGNWEINKLEDTYSHNIVSSINYLNDWGLWFAVPTPPDTFANFDPINSSWSFYGPESSADYINYRVTLMQGVSTWFAIFEYNPDDTQQPEVPFPSWTIQNTHTFTSDEFNVIPLEGWIEDIEIDPLGNLWISHSFGISKFSPGGEWIDFDTNYVSEYAYAAEDIAVGPDNTIWSIYSDVHPYLLQLIPNNTNASESEWVVFDPRDGFPDDNSPTSLTIDWEGNIWIGFDLSNVTARCKYLE